MDQSDRFQASHLLQSETRKASARISAGRNWLQLEIQALYGLSGFLAWGEHSDSLFRVSWKAALGSLLIKLYCHRHINDDFHDPDKPNTPSGLSKSRNPVSALLDYLRSSIAPHALATSSPHLDKSELTLELHLVGCGTVASGAGYGWDCLNALDATLDVRLDTIVEIEAGHGSAYGRTLINLPLRHQLKIGDLVLKGTNPLDALTVALSGCHEVAAKVGAVPRKAKNTDLYLGAPPLGFAFWSIPRVKFVKRGCAGLLGVSAKDDEEDRVVGRCDLSNQSEHSMHVDIVNLVACEGVEVNRVTGTIHGSDQRIDIGRILAGDLGAKPHHRVVALNRTDWVFAQALGLIIAGAVDTLYDCAPTMEDIPESIADRWSSMGIHLSGKLTNANIDSFCVMATGIGEWSRTVGVYDKEHRQLTRGLAALSHELQCVRSVAGSQTQQGFTSLLRKIFWDLNSEVKASCTDPANSAAAAIRLRRNDIMCQHTDDHNKAHYGIYDLIFGGIDKCGLAQQAGAAATQSSHAINIGWTRCKKKGDTMDNATTPHDIYV